ncbi:MAG: hypothetical protein ABIH37_03670 [archaeon]
MIRNLLQRIRSFDDSEQTSRRGFLRSALSLVEAGYVANVIGCSHKSKGPKAVAQRVEDVRKVLGEDYNPEYDEPIEDYEKQLGEEISFLLPTYLEYRNGKKNPESREAEILRKKVGYIFEHPEIVQRNSHYLDFMEYIKDPDRNRGMFNINSIQNDSKIRKGFERVYREDYGLNVDLRNLTKKGIKGDRARTLLFLGYLMDRKHDKLSASGYSFN